MKIFSLKASWVAAFLMLSVGTFAWAADETHWAYSGNEGPEHWGDLSDEFAACTSGKNQSPIDLSGAIDANLPELVFDYTSPGLVSEINNGHTIQENLKPGNYVTIRGQQYEALQFHFHSPSEHHVKGESYPMEVHIVHADEAGDLAVIGIMFEIGDRNPLLDQLDSFRPPDLPPNTEPVDYNAIISSRTEYFNYSGSLTTPPCSEGVLWIVLKEPITASEDQISQFFDTFGFSTNRPIQPHNARTVLE
jgi:carbonic anhydrase